MALADQPIPAEARDGLSRIGLAVTFDSLLRAGDAFIASEQAFRQSARMRIAGFAVALSATDAQTESSRNNEGLGHLDNVLSGIAQGRTQIDPNLLGRINLMTAGDDFRQALVRARDSFAHQLTTQDLDPEDFQEVLGLLDRHCQMITSRGLSGVFDELEVTTRRVRDLRSQPDRGRASGSIPLWKAALVAGILLASVTGVIACFLFSACAWVIQLLAAVSPPTVALINQGC